MRKRVFASTFPSLLRAAPGKGRLEFEASLNGLFSAIATMMQNSSDDTNAKLVQVRTFLYR